ncbi:putative carbon-nitrogen hydrolase [Wickerhamomyces ciferrii]|uniref:Carbon-nitrogen hydrolase n=1 Tax=Wickerhamomyces ciferrii (strain ATCC 14091 / BCRC 22168 / CBS 111 / JCM 3599 / NBRC 0793 / NRRL Y-1031 F-60-10) TaxID=1206466 RepID=K0KH72_WICCF|nr:putative carbon-nitrogen hydrolase [Wickerhamomyces ciferrii]CCH41527.1 putative carbon-nitrogen hydrolase [Wickerhamomyces ciferrii]
MSFQLLAKKLKVALLQITAGSDKQVNLNHAKDYILKALSKDSAIDLVVLPECFNSPYSVTEFAKYAEKIPNGETTKFLSQIAKDNKISIIGGSIPELGDDNKIYNTSITFDKNGEIIGKHRKVHLFDIDIPNGITFKESLTLTSGDKATTIPLEGFGNIGEGICYDIRFPELATIATRKSNAFAMVYPGAFNTVTGPLHWHLLARSRAIDNQIYVILVSPSRNLELSYHAYGHSLVVDPNGKIIAEAGEDEEIIITELDPEVLTKSRSGIPVSTQRRFDIYDDYTETAKPRAI